MRFALPIVSTVLLLGAFLYEPKPPTICFSRRVARIACPGCGLVRSVTSMAQGDWRASLRLHLFGPLFLVAGILVWILSIRGLVKGEPYRIPDTPRMQIAFCLLFVLFILYWIARTAAGMTP